MPKFHHINRAISRPVLSLVAILAMSPWLSAATNLITNGDFSAAIPTTLPPGTSATIIPGVSQPTNWTFVGGTAFNSFNYYTAVSPSNTWIPDPATVSASHSVQLDSYSDTITPAPPASTASASTTITNVASGVYTLTFSMAGEADLKNDGNHPLTTSLFVDVTGASTNNYLSTVRNSTTSGYGVTQSATPWDTYSITFAVTEYEGSLTFTFTDNTLVSVSNNPSLTNVSFVAAPEVSNWTIFVGFGLLCTVMEVRRRRKQISFSEDLA